MNSCKSTLLSACAPPFRMFIIGTGSSTVGRRAAAAELRRSARRAACSSAAARRRGSGHRHAEQRVGAQPALGRACRRARSVASSSARWSSSRADERGRDLAVDVGHRLADALAEIAASCRRRAARALRARRSTRRTARRRGRTRCRRARRLRRSDCRASRESRVRERCVIFMTLRVLVHDAVRSRRRAAAIGRRLRARSASSLIGPMSGSSSAVTTTTPPSVTVWRRRSSSGL